MAKKNLNGFLYSSLLPREPKYLTGFLIHVLLFFFLHFMLALRAGSLSIYKMKLN